MCPDIGIFTLIDIFNLIFEIAYSFTTVKIVEELLHRYSSKFVLRYL